ncbi:MAG: tyrosine-type recombinase/integrase [Propionibacteriaceae bacterium]|nr:tyrosine-type recombinase/integrase [Propionibacteriaceae bacterium]
MSGPLLLPTWDVLAVARPELVVTMRAYLTQLGCVLRPGSVMGADLALRSLAAFLIAEHPTSAGSPISTGLKSRATSPGWQPVPVRTVPGSPPPRSRTGSARCGCSSSASMSGAGTTPPARVPMFHGDVPRQDHALPKALDDPTAAKLLRAGQADKRALVGVTVEFLLRTGLRVGEYTALTADAVVLIGDTNWLHVPVGKLHEDRYLPLHPRVVELVDSYRDAHVPTGHPLLLPRENGKPLDRHTVTGSSTRPAAQQGCPTSTPTSSGTPWRPRRSTAA